MTELEKRVSELTELIVNGNTVSAIETFYADHVTMQENEESPRTGKKLCLEYEKKNLEKVKELNSRLVNQAINNEDGVVFNEWEIIFTDINDKKITLKEVSVQYWEKGLIIIEKFYYKDFA